jgi:hypothetical protein
VLYEGIAALKTKCILPLSRKGAKDRKGKTKLLCGPSRLSVLAVNVFALSDNTSQHSGLVLYEGIAHFFCLIIEVLFFLNKTDNVV